MPIVSGGLGLPEEGALVAAGLGVSETDPNALRAHMYGEGSLTGTLADGAQAPPTIGGGALVALRSTYPKPKPPRRKKPQPIAGWLSAHLTGSGLITAQIDFEIDPDQLAYEFAAAFLLDLV